MGRVGEAQAELRRAQELDPLSLGIQSNVGMISYFASSTVTLSSNSKKFLNSIPSFQCPIGEWACVTSN